MPFNIGPLELVIILVIALLILGPGKLPEVGAALGKSIREFRKAASDVQETASADFGLPFLSRRTRGSKARLMRRCLAVASGDSVGFSAGSSEATRAASSTRSMPP